MIEKRALIIAGYRTLLGREPENEAVVEAAANSLQTPEAIIQHFLSGSEFEHKQGQDGYLATVGLGLGIDRLDIECDVTDAVLSQLFERIRQQWSRLGDTEPYWSVVTDEDYRMASFEENRKAFESSGSHTVTLMLKAMRRTRTPLPKGVCLEFGCGVGRVTRHLSPHFEKVVAVDVAPGNMRLCESYLAAHDVANVQTTLLTTIEDVKNLPECDILHSVIVLQHNPPPIIKYLLQVLLGKIRRGGMAYFQVPTHHLNYRYSAKDHLASQMAELDMHALPMPQVFSALAHAGLEIREVLADGWTGQYGSHTFLAVRP